MPLVKVDFEPSAGVPFDVLFSFPLGLPDVVRCSFSAGTLVRTPELARNERDAFQFIAVETGELRVERGGEPLRLRQGSAILARVGESDRFQLQTSPAGGHRAGGRGIGIIVPGSEFRARGVQPEAAVLRRLTSRCEALGMLRAYVQSVEKSGLDRAAAFGALTKERKMVRRHIFDLVALAVACSGPVSRGNLGAVAQAHLQAALDDIAAHFSDPRLTVEAVAHRQGISARYLQRMMAATGRSYTAVVNEARLQKAFAELTAREQEGRTVRDIAMRTGFSDVSYFIRLFRARYGDSPQSIRALRKPIEVRSRFPKEKS